MKQLNEYVEYTMAQYIIKPRYKVSNKVLLDIYENLDNYKTDQLYIYSTDMNLNIFTDLAIIILGHLLPESFYARPSAIEHYRFNNFDPDSEHLYSYNENGIFLALKMKKLNWRGISKNSSKKAISLLKKIWIK